LATQETKTRQAWLKRRFKGKSFTVKQLLIKYKKDCPKKYASKNKEAHARAFYRDLSKIGIKLENKKYTIRQIQKRHKKRRG